MGKIFRPFLIGIAMTLTSVTHADLKADAIAELNSGEYVAAAEHLKILWQHGDSLAAFTLGKMGEAKLTPACDEKCALGWHLIAASEGVPEAMLHAGALLFNSGQKEKGVHWLEMAARWGQQNARDVLVQMGRSPPAADLLETQEAEKRAEAQRLAVEREAEYQAGVARIEAEYQAKIDDLDRNEQRDQLGAYLIGSFFAGLNRAPPPPMNPPPSPPRRITNSVRMCPDGSFVGGGPCMMAPNGKFVGGKPEMAPDGSFVGGKPKMAPNGQFIGGTGKVTMCPNGSFVSGTCHITPKGTFVGD